jgi:hypothetical protein
LSAPRAWSFITGKQFSAYMEDAERLIHAAKNMGVHPFAAAIAGVALIRNALETMGGDVSWWLDFIRTGNLPGLRTDPREGSQNPPKA